MLVYASDFHHRTSCHRGQQRETASRSTTAENITVRDVRVEWTGGPKTTNGAYGIYPVKSKNVLIEDSSSIGASDAGIYVGQSQNVIVRRNHAEKKCGRQSKLKTPSVPMSMTIPPRATPRHSGVQHAESCPAGPIDARVQEHLH